MIARGGGGGRCNKTAVIRGSICDELWRWWKSSLKLDVLRKMEGSKGVLPPDPMLSEISIRISFE